MKRGTSPVIESFNVREQAYETNEEALTFTAATPRELQPSKSLSAEEAAQASEERRR